MNAMSRKRQTGKELLRKSIILSLSLSVRTALQLLGGLLLAKILGPSLYGLRSAFGVAVQLESTSDLGTFSALNRMAPYYRGQGNFEREKLATSSVFAVNITYAVVAAAVLLAFAYSAHVVTIDRTHVDFLCFLGLVIISGKFKLFLSTQLKINMRFSLLSSIEILHGFTASIGGVVFAYLMGFRGVLISLVLADLLSVFAILTAGERLPRLRLSLRTYWALLRTGFPLMVCFLLLMLLNSVDRMLIVGMISAEALGYYSVATVAAAFIATIPNAVHDVTLAPIMQQLGQSNNITSIEKFLVDPMILMAYTMPIVIGGIYCAIHLPILYFLDQYKESISVVKILGFGAYLQAIASPALSICFALNKQRFLIFIIAPLVVVNIILSFIFIKCNYGIAGVALGTSMSFFLYLCVLAFVVLRQFGGGLVVYAKLIATILVPVGYSMVLLKAIDMLFIATPTTFLADVLNTGLQFSTFVVAYCFLIVLMRKHSAFVKLSQASFRSRVSV